jgi:hypothetical protein
MIATDSRTEPSISAVVGRFMAHAQGYHLRCSRCNAVSVAYAARDALRIICPACERRLTVPATVQAICPTCRRENEYPHHLAGHSTTCGHCANIVTLAPLIGRAESRHRISRRPSRNRAARTLAFTDAAERSLFIVAAAVATLIFLIVTSL